MPAGRSVGSDRNDRRFPVFDSLEWAAKQQEQTEQIEKKAPLSLFPRLQIFCVARETTNEPRKTRMFTHYANPHQFFFDQEQNFLRTGRSVVARLPLI